MGQSQSNIETNTKFEYDTDSPTESLDWDVSSPVNVNEKSNNIINLENIKQISDHDESEINFNDLINETNMEFNFDKSDSPFITKESVNAILKGGSFDDTPSDFNTINNDSTSIQYLDDIKTPENTDEIFNKRTNMSTTSYDQGLNKSSNYSPSNDLPSDTSPSDKLNDKSSDNSSSDKLNDKSSDNSPSDKLNDKSSDNSPSDKPSSDKSSDNSSSDKPSSDKSQSDKQYDETSPIEESNFNDESHTVSSEYLSEMSHGIRDYNKSFVKLSTSSGSNSVNNFKTYDFSKSTDISIDNPNRLSPSSIDTADIDLLYNERNGRH